MNKLFRKMTFLLIFSLTACMATPPNMTSANDEDKDSGLGGTGMLANSGGGNGLGGTGILGEITGYGSIFVNGIEVEYNDNTPFTINGKTATSQQLEIGDVVEILTTNTDKHTQAQIINLRHEIIGKVESVEPETYSFTVRGQTIVQAINKGTPPKVGETVAVSGFRIDKQTILSTRTSSTSTEQTLLRTRTELPFDNKTKQWLVQTYAQANKATVQFNGAAYSFSLAEKLNTSFKDGLAIKILQLRKTATEKLELRQVIEPTSLPRGRRLPNPAQRQDRKVPQKPGVRSGATPNTGASPSHIYGQPKGKQGRKP